MAMPLPEFQFHVSQKRWSCVLDPTLALSAHGIALLNRLGPVMEVWVARELWHILDNTHFYLERPERLFADDGASGPVREVVQTLRDWERLRLENDPSRQQCYWIGDGPLESFLPETIDPEIVWRYEALSAALDLRLKSDGRPLWAGCRDAASLAVALPSTFILTHLSGAGRPDEPLLCRILAEAGITCRAVADDDPWRRAESEFLRQTLAGTGLGKWVWSGLRPVVLHLAAPAAQAVALGLPGELRYPDFESDTAGPESAGEPSVDYWCDAQGFWYPL